MAKGVANIDDGLRERALKAREQFAASGTNVSEWARDRGFSLRLVHQILRGERRCIRGDSHRIAVALGIKADAAAPGAEAAPAGDRYNGARS